MVVQKAEALQIARSKLRDIIEKEALVLMRPGAEITLASGRKSSYYFNMKKVTMQSDAAQLIAQCLLDMTPPSIQYVGGLETGAVPVIVGLILQPGGPKYGFFVRKHAKKHGLREIIEGNFDASQPVVVVDDVTTTGDSVLKAVRAVLRAGGRVSKVIAVVNRMEGGKERIEKMGIPYEAVLTAADFRLVP